jgi:NAD(P)-dependent dehydrogenase (short-subunit alcohol dehydrogenase family)
MSATYDDLATLETPEACFSLVGRVGLITGGAGKMGQRFARVLNNAGATVVVADLQGAVDRAGPAFEPAKGKAPILAVPVDVSDDSGVASLFKLIAANFGRLDFLINNVMAKPKGYYADTFSYDRATWDATMAGNLTSAFLCTRAAAALMIEKRIGGSIVLTSSTYGISGPDQRIYAGCSPLNNPYDTSGSLNAPAVYSASKAGIVGLSRYFATLLGAHGIRVNTFVPGGVYDGQEESFHAEYVHRVPLGRMGSFDDYTGAILFLVGDASRYMTGSSLVVDGGWTAW